MQERPRRRGERVRRRAPVALLRYLAGSPIFAAALGALIAFALGLEEISSSTPVYLEYAADISFSLLETVVFIGVSLFQIFYVRRWFEGRERGTKGRAKNWA